MNVNNLEKFTLYRREYKRKWYWPWLRYYWEELSPNMLWSHQWIRMTARVSNNAAPDWVYNEMQFLSYGTWYKVKMERIHVHDVANCG